MVFLDFLPSEFNRFLKLCCVQRGTKEGSSLKTCRPSTHSAAPEQRQLGGNRARSRRVRRFEAAGSVRELTLAIFALHEIGAVEPEPSSHVYMVNLLVNQSRNIDNTKSRKRLFLHVFLSNKSEVTGRASRKHVSEYYFCL